MVVESRVCFRVGLIIKPKLLLILTAIVSEPTTNPLILTTPFTVSTTQLNPLLHALLFP